MKMICSILLLLSLTSCVSGSFVVNVTQTSYQAEENHNITLEWTFTTRTDSSPNSLDICCVLLAEPRPVLFRLYEGVEDQGSQDKQFAGRVRCDKDVLRDGRIRLHMSRLRINDSGRYTCEVHTGYDESFKTCQLNVTAAADEPKPERPTMRPQPESRGRTGLYVGLTAALALCAGLCFAFCLSFTKSTDNRGNIYRAVQTLSFSCESRCLTTFPNLNPSRSIPNLNSSSLYEEFIIKI